MAMLGAGGGAPLINLAGADETDDETPTPRPKKSVKKKLSDMFSPFRSPRPLAPSAPPTKNGFQSPLVPSVVVHRSKNVAGPSGGVVKPPAPPPPYNAFANNAQKKMG